MAAGQGKLDRYVFKTDVTGYTAADIGTIPIVDDHCCFITVTLCIFDTSSSNPSSYGGYEYSYVARKITGSGIDLSPMSSVVRNVIDNGLYSLESLYFDGVDEYVDMGNVLAFECTNPFSISCWFKINTIQAVNYLIGKVGPGATGYQLFIRNDGSLECDLMHQTIIPIHYIALSVDGSAALDGNWHHVAVTWDGNATPGVGGLHIYLDGSVGAPVSTEDSLGSASIVNANPLQVGATTFGTVHYLDGFMDDVSVYNKELSATEVGWIQNGGFPRALWEAGAPSNLVASWKMGDGDVHPRIADYSPSFAYPTVQDLSGHGYSGTMTNMENIDNIGDIAGDDLSYYSTQSVRFEGASEYVTMGNVLAFERTDPFSLSFWFRTTDTGGPYLIAKMGGGGAVRGYGVALGADGGLTLILRSDNATGNKIVVTTTTVSYNDGAWHCVTWTYSGSSTAAGCACYIDGSVVALTTVTDALAATMVTADPFWLGASYYGGVPGGYYVGFLDEVAVYSKELSAAEATWIYNAGVPRSLSAGGAPSDLAGWWRMGEGDTYPTLLDSSAGAHNGTMTNMHSNDIVQDYPHPRTTFARNSLQFGGTNEYVDMGDVLAFEYNAPFSFSFWMKTTDTSAPNVVNKMANAPSLRGWGVSLEATGALTLILRSDQATNNRILARTTTTGYNDGAWHHVLFTYDGSHTAAGCACYIDGAPVALSALVDNLSATIVTADHFVLAVGYYGGAPSGYYTGYLDEVSGYDRVLTSAEIASVYNGGTPPDLKAWGAPSGLLAWWRLGEGGYPGAMTNMEAGDIQGDVPGELNSTGLAVVAGELKLQGTANSPSHTNTHLAIVEVYDVEQPDI
jgi:hypothetical protein